MMNKFKAVAIAAATVVCAVAPATSSAVSFAAGSQMDFYFGSTITGLSGITFGTTGGATLIDNGGTVGGASATGAALDVTAAGALNTWSAVANQGLTLSATDSNGVTSNLLINTFAYSTATKQLTFNVSINGGAAQAGAFQVYSCSGLFCTPGTQGTNTPFNASTNPPAGLFTATDLRLTSASANLIANGLGLGSYAGLLTSVKFGDLAITAQPVPEPSTYALMGLGLGVAGLIARRRKAA